MRRKFGFSRAFVLLAATVCFGQTPTILPGGVTPIYSTSTTIQPGEWISIYGTNLASGIAEWKGDFPVSLAGTSVTVNGKAAYLWYVSPGQINLQTPDDSATGTVPVIVKTAAGTASSTVTLGRFGPSFSVLDGRHVAGIIFRSDGSGSFGGGTYDIIGPAGSAPGYPTTPARPGDSIALFGVGFGSTTPAVAAGKSFSGAAPTDAPVTIFINGLSVNAAFTGLSGAGLYQLNLTVPSGLGTGDVAIRALVGGVETNPGVVIALDNARITPEIKSVALSANAVASGGTVTGTATLSSPAPPGGAIVGLTSNSSTLSLPASVTIPAGGVTATFIVKAGVVKANETTSITALYGGAAAAATLTVTPVPSPTFSALVLSATWTIVGYPNISLSWTVRPAADAATFTASGTPAFVDCASNKSVDVFSCTSLRSGTNSIFSPAFLNVSGARLDFALTPTTAVFPYTGTFGGNLSVTGAREGASGGSVDAFTGLLTGQYIVVP